MNLIINSLLSSKKGRFIRVSDNTGEIIYIVFYAWDTKRSYYLYGAGNPEKSEPWQGTFAHWKAFEYLAKEESIKIVDLEGVNSPNRGWFKLGFGGELRTYFKVSRILSI